MRGSSTVQKLPPVWLIKTIESFRTLLLKLNKKLFPGNVVLYEQFQYFWLLPALYTAAKLDIATQLKEKPLAPPEIAKRLNLDATNVSRLMRALASQGIFKMSKNGSYALNAMSKPLLDDAPGSLRFMILHHLGPVNWNLMSNLDFAVQTGKDPFREKYKLGIYDFLKDHPKEYVLFDKSMSNLSELGLAPILSSYSFAKFPVIADIGGGEGYLLANILKINPGLKGILFDKPEGLEKANEMLVSHGVADRTTILPGDFFKTAPSGANLYMMKNIIHNWSDDDCVTILSVIAQNMPQNSRLLIIEMVVPEGDKSSLSKLLDIQMMATMEGGRERTAQELKTVLSLAGFSVSTIIPTISPICLIEATRR
jgi:hypothetical protein